MEGDSPLYYGVVWGDSTWSWKGSPFGNITAKKEKYKMS
jgi:hypothetical protein